MAWLKYRICYAEGYGEPKYIEVHHLEDLEEIKWGIRDSETDGLRTPEWEILDALPPEVLEEKIQVIEHDIKDLMGYLERLKNQRA